MNWAMIFGAGLLAGATTCAVTQGGLLVGLISRQRKAQGGSGARTAGDDLAPVGGFLFGKLISHTLAGAALGAIGGAFGFNPQLGAAVQWLAGLVMVVLGLGAMGVPGLREIQFNPPTAWMNTVRKSTRSQSATAPFLLGLAVLLVPCGVTISMEVLAASSGSAMLGALVMAVFVIGTAPMFTVFGYLSAKLPMSRAFGLGLGALVVAFGFVTINAALVASGIPFNFQALMNRQDTSVSAPAPNNANVDPNKTQVITINATSNAYVPNEVTASAAAPIKLKFVTKDTYSCILATTLPTLGQQIVLPQTGTQYMDLGRLDAGDYPISCSMGMYTATLHVSA